LKAALLDYGTIVILSTLTVGLFCLVDGFYVAIKAYSKKEIKIN